MNVQQIVVAVALGLMKANVERGRGHAGVVQPNSGPFDAAKGPMIGQAGENVGVFSAQDSFHANGLTPRYFALSRR